MEKVERWLDCGCKLVKIKSKYRWQRCPKAVEIYEQFQKTKDPSWDRKYSEHFKDKVRNY
jgi:hypothetical protein